MSIEDYRLYLSAQNMSENTIHVYAYAIRQFFALYHEITYSNLKLYKVFLLEHYKPQTVNLRIRALNSYIEFKKLNPGKIPMVRIQHKNYLDNVISEADYEYLKNCLLRDEKYLYYFIIRFMAATGARVSEVIQFEAEDIFTGYKDIYSKGNKVRRIYVPKALQKDAIAWLKAIRQERGFVFLNRYGNPITPGGIRGQLKNMALAYGMNQKWFILILSATVLPKALSKNAEISLSSPICLATKTWKPPGFICAVPAVSNMKSSTRWWTGNKITGHRLQ